jgi:glutathione S-transferase
MITLYTFGRRFGLPDPSPFVTKAEVLLKMSGLDYRTDKTGFNKAPKGKLPYINDEGTIVADSTFIRFHLEARHGIDFDKGLSAVDKAVAWATEKMCDDHLYWAVLDNRWMVDANFDKGPRTFFAAIPAPLRPFVVRMVRRQVRNALRGHGMGRHSRREIEQLAARDIDTLAAILGDKAWLGGTEPCGADATLWSFVSGVLCSQFPGPIRDHALGNARLLAYSERGFARWFPELQAPR